MALPAEIRNKLTAYTEMVVADTLDRGLRTVLLDVSVTVAPAEVGSVSEHLRDAGLIIDSQVGDVVLGRIEAVALTGLARLADVRQIEVSHRAKLHVR